MFTKFTKGADELKHDMTFFNELVKYDTLSVQLARFRKKMFLEFELQTRCTHKFKR